MSLKQVSVDEFKTMMVREIDTGDDEMEMLDPAVVNDKFADFLKAVGRAEIVKIAEEYVQKGKEEFEKGSSFLLSGHYYNVAANIMYHLHEDARVGELHSLARKAESRVNGASAGI